MWWRTLLEIVTILGSLAAGVFLAFKLEQDYEIAHKIAIGAFVFVLAIDFIPASNNFNKPCWKRDPNTGFTYYSPCPPPKLSEFPLWADWLWPMIKEDIRGGVLVVIAFCITWAGLRLFKVIGRHGPGGL
jgi:hypothetical protein